MPKISASDLPKPATMVKAVGSAAGQLAERSSRVGRIASEVQRATEADQQRRRLGSRLTMGFAEKVLGGAVAERMAGGQPGVMRAVAGAVMVGGVTTVVVYRLLRKTEDEEELEWRRLNR